LLVLLEAAAQQELGTTKKQWMFLRKNLS